MSKFQSPLLNFAEAVLAKESGIQEGNHRGTLASGWADRQVGVIKARTVKRHPETLKWDRELYDAMNFVPWLIDGPVTRPEAGWEPTPGCKACDEEGSGVKRRCRPFNHTAE